MAHPSRTGTETAYLNPLIEQRADPWIYRHTDGFYYFTGSVPEFDRIEVRRASTIQGLAYVAPVTVWKKHDQGRMASHIWAPEIHNIDGSWYIYFAAAPSGETINGLFDHRMFVIANGSANPLEGEWTEKGQLKTEWESFSLDATTFKHRDVQYLVWAQQDPAVPGHSNIYLAPLANPWTLAGPQICLTRPELPWEIQGFLVNEGPAVLKKNGKVWISYSASATDERYCMGLLHADESSDLMDPASWTKSAQPVFQSSEETGQYGPGHNCFTVSESGEEDVLVYHARSYRQIVGDPLYDPNRHARAQLLRWKADGMPDFGIPAPDNRNNREPSI